MLLNIVLNFIFIPKYQVVGCAMASLLTQVFTSFWQFGLAVRIFRFSINYKLIVQFVIYPLLMIGAMIFVQGLVLNIYLKMGILVGSFLLLIMLTGIVSPGSLRKLMKEA